MSVEVPAPQESLLDSLGLERELGNTTSLTLPFAEGGGKVVFSGPMAQTTTYVLGFPIGDTISAAEIENHFSIGWEEVERRVAGINDGLAIAGIQATVISEED